MRVVVILVILVAVGLTAYLQRNWILGLFRIASMKNEDPELTRAYVKKYIDDSLPGYHLPDVVRAEAALKVSLFPLPTGTVTIDPTRGPGAVTTEALEHRRQYEVRIWNESEETFSDVALRFQSPYPIEFADVTPLSGAVDISFEPDLRLTVKVSGAGAGVTYPKLLTRAWNFRAAGLGPGGSVKILFIANSARDPRGRKIDPAQAPRYMIPEVGPLVTYIDGHFFVKIDDKTRVKKGFYLPLSLTRDRVITLGEPSTPPKSIVQITEAVPLM